MEHNEDRTNRWDEKCKEIKGRNVKDREKQKSEVEK